MKVKEYTCLMCGDHCIGGNHSVYCEKCRLPISRIRKRFSYRKTMGRSKREWAEKEDESIKYLAGSKKICYPCDLQWGDKLVDVKMASHENAYIGQNKKGVNLFSWRWRFPLSRQKGIADYFLCMGYDENMSNLRFVMLIPDKDIPTKNFSVSRTNAHKYEKYLLEGGVF